MKIDLSAYLKNTIEVYKPLCFNFVDHFFLWGSRQSGKSWFVVDYVMMCCILFPGLHVLLLRCINVGIEDTTYKTYRDAIDRLKIRALIKVDCKTYIEFKNGSVIKYKGMYGNEASLKNSEYDLYVYEEAEQSLRPHYTALDTNFRKGQSGLKKSICGRYTFNKKLIMAMNPPTEIDHYSVFMFENQAEFGDTKFLKTTIDDNPHATEKDYERLEKIKLFDEHDYRRLRYGEIAKRTEGLLFLENKHFFFVSEKTFSYMTDREVRRKELESKKDTLSTKQQICFEKSINKKMYLHHVMGGDWAGGNGGDPLTLLDIYIDMDKRNIYVKDLIFDNTIADPLDFYKVMKKRNIRKDIWMFWDNQNQIMNKDLRGKGYKADDAKKTGILDGLNKLKTFKIFICASNTYRPTFNIKQKKKQLPLKQQIPNYSRIFDKRIDGFRNEPETGATNQGIDFWDALRYGVITFMEIFGKK